MTDQLYFRFKIELTPDVNPRYAMDRLQEELRAWFTDRSLSHVSGNFGGTRLCCGEVGPPATEGDRQAMAEWMAAQRLSATVRLESLTLYDPTASIDATNTDWVFSIDNLTETERAEAVAYNAQMRSFVQSRSATTGRALDHPKDGGTKQ